MLCTEIYLFVFFPLILSVSAPSREYLSTVPSLLINIMRTRKNFSKFVQSYPLSRTTVICLTPIKYDEPHHLLTSLFTGQQFEGADRVCKIGISVFHWNPPSLTAVFLFCTLLTFLTQNSASFYLSNEFPSLFTMQTSYWILVL